MTLRLLVLLSSLIYGSFALAIEQLPKPILIQGDNCFVSQTFSDTSGDSFSSLYVEFDKNVGDEFSVYALIGGLPSEDYKDFFVEKVNRELTEYPFYLEGESKDGLYIIEYTALKRLGGDADAFLHESMIFHFDSEGKLSSIDATYEKRWPFPSNLTKNVSISKTCLL